METLKKKIGNLSLRHFLILTVFVVMFAVTAVSGLTIFTCVQLRQWLLPEGEQVHMRVQQVFADGSTIESVQVLKLGEEMNTVPIGIVGEKENPQKEQTKYSIEKIESSYDGLSPKRRFLYQFLGIAMAAVPVLLSLAGILVCGFFFYKKKLAEPITVLSAAMKKIAAQDLDFTVTYEKEDEMGRLCASFEQMRSALYESNKAMWSMLEERRLMQASIAHDLRNPIAIIEGYTEYLQMNLAGGKLEEGQIRRIVKNLGMSAKRLEQYTESVRALNQMEDMELHYTKADCEELADEMADDLAMIVSQKGISLHVEDKLCEENEICGENRSSKRMIWLDCAVLYRILENVFGNAVRFAKKEIRLVFTRENDMLKITVTDDGEGFPDAIIGKQTKLFVPSRREDGHLGMGLAVSRLLCKKHGGELKIYNDAAHHAVAEIAIKVSDGKA